MLAFPKFVVPQPGSLSATTSIFSMVGGCSKSSGAFSIKAAATLPERCACLPASSENTSKIPKVDGPKRIPNQLQWLALLEPMAIPHEGSSPRQSPSQVLPAF